MPNWKVLQSSLCCSNNLIILYWLGASGWESVYFYEVNSWGIPSLSNISLVKFYCELEISIIRWCCVFHRESHTDLPNRAFKLSSLLEIWNWMVSLSKARVWAFTLPLQGSFKRLSWSWFGFWRNGRVAQQEEDLRW